MSRNAKSALRGLSIGLMILGSVTLLTFALSAQAGLSTGNTDLAVLRGLQRSYAAIESVQLEASIHMWLRGTQDDPFPATIGNGTYAFWGAGAQYRIRTELDEDLGLAGNLDLAYDGRQFQIHDFATDTLSYQTSDTRALPISIPNPLFLAIDFINRDNDACPACSTLLGDMGDRAHWNQRLQDTQSITRGGATAVRVPGGTYQGTAFHFEVTLADFPQGRLPAQIDRYADDGRIMARVVLHEYELVRVGRVEIPVARRLSIASADFEGDRQQNMFADIDITTLEINNNLPSDAFAIDIANAGTVWDGDQGRFLKHATRNPSTAPAVRGTQR